jgi:uncharacterized protein (DUF362 family)
MKARYKQYKGNSNRREFLRLGLVAVAGTPILLQEGLTRLHAGAEGAAEPSAMARKRAEAKVAIVQCRTYGPEVRTALAQSFDLLGGIGSLVRNRTVTVKLNLTGTDFSPFLQRPVGETYMTHYSTAAALGALLFDSGARRVRFVESTQRQAQLGPTLALADWDLKALAALGKVEFENTRNLGTGGSYARLAVANGGYMFSSFEVNRAYADTDVMISLAKLKNHVTAGVTLSMKNLFGITPNSLYGAEAGREDATEGRDPLHNPRGYEKLQLPGLKEGIGVHDATWRVPRIVADICAARPIQLSIIDGITSMSGGEGPWCSEAGPLKVTTPGVLIVGLNPVSTDAVGTAVMGYDNPRALRGVKPFHFCDNHLQLAEAKGVGSADLGQIEVLGLSVDKARYPYG